MQRRKTCLFIAWIQFLHLWVDDSPLSSGELHGNQIELDSIYLHQIYLHSSTACKSITWRSKSFIQVRVLHLCVEIMEFGCSESLVEPSTLPSTKSQASGRSRWLLAFLLSAYSNLPPHHLIKSRVGLLQKSIWNSFVALMCKLSDG